MMGRRAKERINVSDETRERGQQRRVEEREWRADQLGRVAEYGLSGEDNKEIS